MKILQAHNSYRRAGGEDAVADSEARLLRDAGHDVITWRARNATAGASAAMQMALAPWNPRRYVHARAAALRLKPDVVHVHNTWFALSSSVIPAFKSVGTPVVVTLHNYRPTCVNATLFRNGGICEDCVGKTPMAGVRHRCYRGSYSQSAVAAAAIAVQNASSIWSAADRVVVLSDFARRLFAGAGLPADRLHVKPNFAPDPGSRTRPPSASSRLLFAGRLTEEKGVRTLVSAWRERRPQGLTLTVVGDGPLASEVADPGVGIERRSWLSQRQLNELLLDSRALLMPSMWYEGQPRVALEGMAAGLPVIGSALGGLGDLVGEVDSRCSVPPTPRGWAASLERLSDASWVDDVGARARRRYLARFNERAGLAGLEALYRGLG